MIFNFLDDDFFNMWNSSSTYPEYDWEQLKKEGTVNESISETNGFKTVTRTFVSFDGKSRITSTSSCPIIDETKKRMLEIDKQIQTAVKNEDYEKAAKLKEEKENLLKTKKTTPTKKQEPKNPKNK